MAFREFSQTLGKLTQATKLTPLYPIKPAPLSKAVDQPIIYDSINTRPASTDIPKSDPPGSPSRPTLPDYVKKFQDHCQANIHKETYIIAGKRDQIMFGTSAVLLVGGLSLAIEFIIPYLSIK